MASFRETVISDCSNPRKRRAEAQPHLVIRLSIRSLENRSRPGTARLTIALEARDRSMEERAMGFGRGALLWLLGVPLPIILLLAIFWHH